MSKNPDIDKVRKYLVESGYPQDGDALLSLDAVEAELAPKTFNPQELSEVLADMDLIIEQEHGSEFGARSLKEHLISFRARIESALASAEPVAWYAPSIDDTCTAAKKAQRERDLPELARLFAVPLHTHPSPAHAGAGAEAVSESAMMEYARGKGWPVTLHKYVPVGDGTWYHNFDITIPTHELAKFFPARRLAGGDHA